VLARQKHHNQRHHRSSFTVPIFRALFRPLISSPPPATSVPPYSLTSAVVEEAISTRTAAIISYHPPIFKPISSFTLTNPLQQSLLLCAAQGISVFSPHTALDSVRGGINDWLSDIVRMSAAANDIAQPVEYVGTSKEEDLGGEGRLVRFQQPVELDSLVNTIKEGLALSAGAYLPSTQASMII
jgi:putative NIF3 family GTP cyclohydrolase 1 type 2